VLSKLLTKLTMLLGAIVAVALVVVSLWGWAAAEQLVPRAVRPELALWAVRSAAVAALAAAQVLGLTFVVGLFERDGSDRQSVGGQAMRLAAGFVCTAALVGAIALGIMSSR
jgi:hypothetical protein